LFLYLLEIITHPQSRAVALRSSVSLTCASSVSSDVTSALDVKFSWTRDGKDVTGQSKSTGNTSILTIRSFRERNVGSYVCTVRSGLSSVMSNTATITAGMYHTNNYS